MEKPTDERLRAVERIRKMLAMGGSANENEASAFMERAHAEMARLQISMTEIHQREGGEEEIEMDSELLSDPYPWTYVVAIGCAKLYFCTHFYSDDTRPLSGAKVYRHSFVGSRANITVAKLMFQYLCSTINRLARQAANVVPEKQRSPFRTAFRNTCAKRLRARMDARIDDAKDGGIVEANGNTLPALLDVYEQAEAKTMAFTLAKMGELVDVQKKLAVELSPLGAIAGHAAGDTISLDDQVEDQRRKQIGKK